MIHIYILESFSTNIFREFPIVKPERSLHCIVRLSITCVLFYLISIQSNGFILNIINLFVLSLWGGKLMLSAQGVAHNRNKQIRFRSSESMKNDFPGE